MVVAKPVVNNKYSNIRVQRYNVYNVQTSRNIFKGHLLNWIPRQTVFYSAQEKCFKIYFIIYTRPMWLSYIFIQVPTYHLRKT